jgi:hypothetical protein
VSYVAFACWFVIGLVFAVSAVSKVSGRVAFREFESALRALRLVPPRLVMPLAGTVVAVEFAVPVALVTGSLQAGSLLPGAHPGAPIAGATAAGLLLAVLLLLAFIGVTVRSVHRRAAVPCRCFGTGGAPLGYPHVARNALLIAIAVTGWWAPGAGTSYQAAGITLAIAGGAVAASLLIRFDDVVDVFAAR